MKVRKISINIEEFDSSDHLNQADQKLLGEAHKAVKSSYAPYSEFHVGAAALLDSGKIISGSNQENAAYPSGLCAERVTLFHAKSQFPDATVQSIAVTAHSSHFNIYHPITPCGACRQVIAEVQNRQTDKIRIIMQGEKGAVIVSDGIENLLPLMFKDENLKRSKTKL